MDSYNQLVSSDVTGYPKRYPGYPWHYPGNPKILRVGSVRSTKYES
jgi:hypothetical protein